MSAGDDFVTALPIARTQSMQRELAMKTARLSGMGWLGAILVLSVACAGKVRNLGDEEAAGAGGKGGSAGKGGAAVGGAVDSEKGGSTALGGQGGNTDFLVGGSTAQGGGTYSTYPGTAFGGTTGVGGNTDFLMAGTTALEKRPYPYAPTLPIDPTCKCDSPTQICNAARECVDRCVTEGPCAMWLTNRAVTDLYVEGATLYYTTSAVADPLGNPGTNGSLYRVEYPNGAPTLIATELREPSRIIGRYNGATLLQIGTDRAWSYIVRVTDAGASTKLDNLAGFGIGMCGKWLAGPGSDHSKLVRIDLDGDLTPEVIVDLSTGSGASSLPNSQAYIQSAQISDDYIWYAKNVDSTNYVCYLRLANLALGPTCLEGFVAEFSLAGANGDQVFGSDISTRVLSLDINGKRLTLFQTANIMVASVQRTIYKDGWLYSTASSTTSVEVQLLRYPSTVGRLPQGVLPSDIATNAFMRAGSTVADTSGFTVGSPGLFWFQAVTDKSQGQYIFHAPLPPQPCDAELPCADTTQTCTSGFCAAP
jgi:hypothetical protein